MKRILTENIENKSKVEEERRLELSKTFRTATFEDLITRTQPKVNNYFYKILIFFQHSNPMYLFKIINFFQFFFL